MLPRFIIIGAMKAGTSSLFQYVASHRDVVSSSVKETDFFKTDDDFAKGRAWYESLFQGPGRHAFEASPNYSKRHIFPGVPRRMHSLVPDAKLIYVLRDPVERLISHYLHNYALGLESSALEDIVRDPRSNYILSSAYYYQWEAFLEYYGPEQALLVESEELKIDPAFVLDRVFRFVGIPADYDASVLNRRFHESSAKRRPSALERALLARTSRPTVQRVIRGATRVFRTPVERPPLSADALHSIRAALADDVARLRRFSGLAFSRWSI